jgi:chloramphenicol 3-O phosphotransferase
MSADSNSIHCLRPAYEQDGQVQAMRPGTILVLNGTSSAGKSTIITLLQDMLEGPFLHAGMDRFFHMLPKRYLWGPQWVEVLGNPPEPGPVGITLTSGMHHAIAALSRAGNRVLVDHVLSSQTWVAECAALFAPLPAYLIGVICPLLVAEQREQQRRDRAPGQARAHFDRVHAYTHYDLTVDTAVDDAATCARTIAQFLERGTPPSAWGQIARQRRAEPE